MPALSAPAVGRERARAHVACKTRTAKTVDVLRDIDRRGSLARLSGTDGFALALSRDEGVIVSRVAPTTVTKTRLRFKPDCRNAV